MEYSYNLKKTAEGYSNEYFIVFFRMENENSKYNSNIIKNAEYSLKMP